MFQTFGSKSLTCTCGDQVAELVRLVELAVGGEELGVDRHPAARVALAGAEDVVDRRADRARDRLDRQHEAVLLGDVEQRRQAVEVPLEVAVAVGKLPEVEDDEPGAELAGDPAVEAEAGDVRLVGGERRAGALVRMRGDDRQPLEIVDHALVPASVDRQLELARRE